MNRTNAHRNARTIGGGLPETTGSLLVQPDGLRTYVYGNGRAVYLVRPAVSP